MGQRFGCPGQYLVCPYTSDVASSCLWSSCVSAGGLGHAPSGNRSLGCTQQLLLCCWVREAASSRCSVLALTQQSFLLAIPQIPDLAAPSPEPSAGTCGGLERAVRGGGGVQPLSVRFCLFTDVFKH